MHPSRDFKGLYRSCIAGAKVWAGSAAPPRGTPVQNTGSGQMRLLLMIAPAGLEDWFRAIARPRRPGDAMPAPFERPADVAEIQARARFVREG
jgi:hypothetical protein